MSAADLVFADGDRVLAMGKLIRRKDEWWLDSHRMSSIAASGDRGPTELSSRLAGADALIKAFQAQDRMAAKFWVHVVGRWQRGIITVEAIGAGAGRPDPGDTEVLAEADASVVAEIEATISARSAEWGIESWSMLAIALFRVTAEIAEWADQQPDGLVRLDPSVRRVS